MKKRNSDILSPTCPAPTDSNRKPLNQVQKIYIYKNIGKRKRKKNGATDLYSSFTPLFKHDAVRYANKKTFMP